MAGVPLDACLLAYPPRWRAARRAELADLLVELDDAVVTDRGLRVRGSEAVSLVVAGLATRWRTGPSLLERFRYRWLEGRLAPRHRGWVHDELSSVGGALGESLWLALPFVALAVLLREPWALVTTGCVVAVALVRRAGGSQRRKMRQLVPTPDEPATPWDHQWAAVPRVRVAAPGALVVLLVTAAALLAAAVRALLVAPGSWSVSRCGPGCVSVDVVGTPAAQGAVLGLVGGVLAVGLVLAALALRAWRPEAVPAQPSRVLVPATRTLAFAARVTLGALVTGALLLQEAATAATFAYPVAVAAGLLVPPLAVTAWAARGRTDLALVDVAAVARGRAPEADPPRWVVVPWPDRPTEPVADGRHPVGA